MKRLLSLIVAMATAGIFAQTLEFETTTFDFGEIDNVRRVSQRVMFKNTGDKPLVVDKVNASCGCTAGKLDKSELQPGEESFVEITFNPSGKSGNIRKSVTFHSNDPAAKEKPVFFTAKIVPIWDFNPRRLEFKVQDGGFDVLETEFTISNSGKEPLQILGMAPNNEALTIDGNQEAGIEPGASETYKVKIDPKYAPEKSVYSRILIRTKLGDSTDSRSLSVYIRNPKPQN